MTFLKFLKNILMMVIYPRPLLGLIYLPRFIYHWIMYEKINSDRKLRILDAYPCLGDWVSNTPFDSHYFYQASWLSRKLASSNTPKHLDIGSDVKMIAILSAFVPIEFMDFRPLDVNLKGLDCTSGDILELPISNLSVKSLSCLHVIEHIGLGRYGDALDPVGSQKALRQLERVIALGGKLYLSVPIGRERICFNAHRVFNPKSIIEAMPSLILREFSYVDDHGRFHENQKISDLKTLEYGCGMFYFEKL